MLLSENSVSTGGTYGGEPRSGASVESNVWVNLVIKFGRNVYFFKLIF